MTFGCGDGHGFGFGLEGVPLTPHQVETRRRNMPPATAPRLRQIHPEDPRPCADCGTEHAYNDVCEEAA